ncbi:MAG: hypothetical protein ACRD0Z_00550 [Acidimicrobiales bacterium]
MRREGAVASGTGFACLAATVLLAVGGPGVAASSTQLPAASLQPKVVSFTVSPKQLSGSGGKVTARATVSHASKCALTSSPLLTGLPKVVGCTNGKLSVGVTVLPNHSKVAKSEKFTLTAMKSTLKSAPVSSAVTEVPPLGWASQVGLPTSSVFDQINGISCVSANFCLAVDSDTDNSVVWNGSAWVDGMHLTGMSPNAIACATTTFCMAVGVYGMEATFNGSTWSAPVQIDTTSNNDLASVACSTPSLCVVSDDASYVVGWNGTSWTSPVLLDLDVPSGDGFFPEGTCTAGYCLEYAHDGFVSFFSESAWSTPSQPLGDELSGVSCASPTFCLAEAGDGDTATYDGSSWTALDPSAPGAAQFGDLFCQSSASCEQWTPSVDGQPANEVQTFDGSDWTSGPVILPGPPQGGMSCPTQSFCVEVIGTAQVITFDPLLEPGNSASQSVLPNGAAMTSVSCVSSSWCTAVDADGQYLVESDGKWSIPAVANPGGYLTSVSCISESSCVAVDAQGNAVSYDGTSWSTPDSIDEYGLTTVSCVASDDSSGLFCMAGDEEGEALSFDGTTWSTPQVVPGPSVESESSITSVSCASVSLCFATQAGNVAEYDGSWQAASPVDGLGVTDVSCPSATFCIAVGGQDAADFGGSSWTSATQVESSVFFGLISVSCATSSACMAVDTAGDSYSFDGSAWTETIDATGGDGPWPGQLSCASSSSCEAVLGYNTEAWSAGSWGPEVPTDEPPGNTSASCPTSTFCVVVGSGGYVLTGTAQGWSEERLEGLSSGTVSCASPSLCMVVGYGSGPWFWNGSTWTDVPISPTPGSEPTDVSCAPPTLSTFCLVTTGESETFVFDGSGWSGPYSSGIWPEEVSCVTATFCMGVSGYDASIFNGTSWGPTLQDGLPTTDSSGVSCTSPTFCMVVGLGAGEFESAQVDSLWDGVSWTLDENPGLDSAGGPPACVSDTFCVDDNRAWNGSEWSQGGAFTGTDTCPTIDLCYFVGGATVGTFDPSDLLFDTTVDPQFQVTSVSCSGPGLCIAVDNRGEAFVSSSGDAWTSEGVVDKLGDLTSISCISATTLWCMAVDTSGRELVDADGVWSTPVPVSSGALVSVSCVSETFCAAVDDGGNSYVFDGSSWSAPHQLLMYGAPLDVSCGSPTLCVVANTLGDVSQWNGVQWLPYQAVGVVEVSCPTSSFCVGVGSPTGAWSFDGTSWTTTSSTPSLGNQVFLTDVACADTDFCVAVDSAGMGMVYDGTSWYAPVQVTPAGDGLSQVDCPSVTYCVALDSYNTVYSGNA